MNKSIKINEHDVAIKEHNGQRVVTFKDVDEVHDRPEGTARRNFNDNKKRFIKGTDYFVRNSYEAKNEFGIAAPNGLTLLTESGYLMLVKSFTDDLAWDVQRKLVNSYFRVKQKSSAPAANYQNAIAEAKLNNSRARLSSAWLKLADRVPEEEYKQICNAYASTVLAGREVLPLPDAGEKLLQAKDIAEMFAISANKVGKIAKLHNLKNSEYGKWVHDKSPYSNKEVETFRYNHKAIEKFRELLKSGI